MAVPPGLRSDFLQLYADALRNAIDYEPAAAIGVPASLVVAAVRGAGSLRSIHAHQFTYFPKVKTSW
jgi:hypothetical protein